jgi:hypothetical protein
MLIVSRINKGLYIRRNFTGVVAEIPVESLSGSGEVLLFFG